MIFETKRLIIRQAIPEKTDIEFFNRLWNDPKVMKFVGYPYGLNISREKIEEGIRAEDESPYDKKLVVVEKESGEPIGECKLGRPDKDKISETDVKLLPEYWRKGYGTEIKQNLVEYLFRNTDCIGVKATPNKANIASQKMQEKVGARRVREGTFRFPKHMRKHTCEVPYYEYIVYRHDWENLAE